MPTRFPQDRFAYRPPSSGKSGLNTASGMVVDVFQDAAATIVPAITTLAGVAIPGARLVIDQYSQIPEFLHPSNSIDTLWLRPVGQSATFAVQAVLQDQVARQVAVAVDAAVEAETGGTSEAVAGEIVRRDSNGRAKVSAPVTSSEIATKGYVDAAVGGVSGVPAGGLVTSVNGRQNAVTLTKTDVGLSLVDNTSDLGKPVSTAQAAAIEQAKDRSFHTGTQPSSTISDLKEFIEDTVAALLSAGTNVSLTYNDAAGTLTVSSSGGGGGTGGTDLEEVRDAIGIALLGVGAITVTPNDAADTITISTTATVNSTDAALRDRATHTGVQAISTVSGLQGALDAKAVDADVVKLTGNQVVNGIKTFSSAPAVPDASFTISKVSGLQTVLDGKASTSGTVLTTGAQSIDGVKTFVQKPVVPSAAFPISAVEGLQQALADAIAGEGITDHGLLSGLLDDDHPQYFNQARGDARYALGSTVSSLSTTVSGHAVSISGLQSGDVTIGGTKTFTLAPVVPNGAWTIAKTSGLQTALDGKADDISVVKTSGNQSIAGIKTFTVAPGVPTGAWTIDHTSGLQAALDAKATDSGLVHLAGAESITGAKTFTVAPTVPDNSFAISKVNGLTTALANKADTTSVVLTTGAQTVAGVKTFSSAPVVPSGSFTTAVLSDFTEAVQDGVGAFLVAGSNITLTYDDVANSLTITGNSTDQEVVRDTIGSTLQGSGLITVTPNDALDTITITTTATANATDTALRDRSTHTGTQAINTVTNLQTTLDAKATDTAVVHLAGTETISGAKTFTTAPGVPDGSFTIAKTTSLQATLDLKAPLASPTFTGTVSGITKAMVGLGSVDNTTDANKPISSATQAALNDKAPIASPTFTGTVSGITKAMVGLGSVDNTADAAKPISTLTQAALDLKAADNAVVKLTGAQTIAGVKTFSSAPAVPDGSFTIAKVASLQTALDGKQAMLPYDVITYTGSAWPARVAPGAGRYILWDSMKHQTAPEPPWLDEDRWDPHPQSSFYDTLG